MESAGSAPCPTSVAPDGVSGPPGAASCAPTGSGIASTAQNAQAATRPAPEARLTAARGRFETPGAHKAQNHEPKTRANDGDWAVGTRAKRGKRKVSNVVDGQRNMPEILTSCA